MKIKTRRINLNISIESVAERHPVPVLGVDYRVKIIYKNVKCVELTIEDKNIKVFLPNKFKKVNNEKVLDLAINKMYEQLAQVEVERAMEKTRLMTGIAPEDYEIRDIGETLGMCENEKITINPKIIKYNRRVIDYIVLHQYCHLKYKTHCKGFYNMLKKFEPNYKWFENL